MYEAWQDRDTAATYTAIGRHIIPVATGLVARIDPRAAYNYSLRTKAAEFDMELDSPPRNI